MDALGFPGIGNEVGKGRGSAKQGFEREGRLWRRMSAVRFSTVSHRKIFKHESHRMIFVVKKHLVIGGLKARKWSKYKPSWGVSTPATLGKQVYHLKQQKTSHT